MSDRTAASLSAFVKTIFVGTWIVLAIVGFVASRQMGAAAKRRWMPRYGILAGVLFVFFATTLSLLSSRSWSSLKILLLLIPAVSLVSYLNYKNTKYCDNCGATQYNHGRGSSFKFCAKCGTSLDPPKPPRTEDLLE